jgi:hypothetical protein
MQRRTGVGITADMAYRYKMLTVAGYVVVGDKSQRHTGPG